MGKIAYAAEIPSREQVEQAVLRASDYYHAARDLLARAANSNLPLQAATYRGAAQRFFALAWRQNDLARRLAALADLPADDRGASPGFLSQLDHREPGSMAELNESRCC